MINFRFHLVSIAAIMLALAAGIALGSGPLDDTGGALRGVSDTGSPAIDPALTAFQSSYAARTSGALTKGVLKGQSVLLISVPGTSAAEINGIAGNLAQAGAAIAGRVALTDKLLDPAGRQFAEGVAQQSASDVPGVNANGDGYGRIGAALARAFLARKTAPLDETATTIRTAYTEAGLVTLTARPKKSATLAVLVAAPKRTVSSDQGNVLAALAAAVDERGRGLVIAGPSTSSGEGGEVKAVRDSAAAGRVSTVDVTDTAAGWVLTALAAASEASGKSGSWGTSRSADGALPQ